MDCEQEWSPRSACAHGFLGRHGRRLCHGAPRHQCRKAFRVQRLQLCACLQCSVAAAAHRPSDDLGIQWGDAILGLLYQRHAIRDVLALPRMARYICGSGTALVHQLQLYYAATCELCARLRMGAMPAWHETSANGCAIEGPHASAARIAGLLSHGTALIPLVSPSVYRGSHRDIQRLLVPGMQATAYPRAGHSRVRLSLSFCCAEHRVHAALHVRQCDQNSRCVGCLHADGDGHSQLLVLGVRVVQARGAMAPVSLVGPARRRGCARKRDPVHYQQPFRAALLACVAQELQFVGRALHLHPIGRCQAPAGIVPCRIYIRGIVA